MSKKNSKSHIGFLLALFFLGAIAYCNSLKNNFHDVDYVFINQNSYIQKLSLLEVVPLFKSKVAFEGSRAELGYQPLTVLALSVLWKIGHHKSWPFHVYMFLLHFMSSLFIFKVALKLLRRARNHKSEEKLFLTLSSMPKSKSLEVSLDWMAFIGSAVFIIHPATTQVLNHISDLGFLQGSFFYIAAFWYFLKSQTQQGSKGRFGLVMLMSLMLLGAVNSAAFTWSFPLLLIIHVLIFKQPEFNFIPFLKRFLVSFFCSVGIVALNFWTLNRINFPLYDWSALPIGKVEFFVLQLWSWLKAFIALVIPFGYRLDHSMASLNLITNNSMLWNQYWDRLLIGIIFGVSLIWFLMKLIKYSDKKNGLQFVVFALLWGILHFLCATLRYPSLELVYESRFYLGHAMLTIGGVYAGLIFLSRLDFFSIQWSLSGSHQSKNFFTNKTKPILISIGLLIFMTTLMALTIYQNTKWKNSKKLWQNVIAHEPYNGRAFNQLGEIYAEEKDFARALVAFNKCTEYWPEYIDCYLNLHLVYLATGDIERAREAIYKVNALNSEYVLGRYRYASFLLDVEKQPDQAIDVLQDCDRIAAGKYFPCLNLMIEAHKKMDNPAAVVSIARRALELKSEDRDVKFSLGLSLTSIKKWSEAKKIFMEIYDKDSKDIQAIYNIAWLEMKQENWGNSKQRWLETIALDPNIEGAWINLQSVAEKLGDKTLMAHCKRELRKLNPLNPGVQEVYSEEKKNVKKSKVSKKRKVKISKASKKNEESKHN